MPLGRSSNIINYLNKKKKQFKKIKYNSMSQCKCLVSRADKFCFVLPMWRLDSIEPRLAFTRYKYHKLTLAPMCMHAPQIANLIKTFDKSYLQTTMSALTCASPSAKPHTPSLGNQVSSWPISHYCLPKPSQSQATPIIICQYQPDFSLHPLSLP